MLKGTLSAEELAKYLEIDVSSILEWANSGKIPAFKEGNDWKFEFPKIEEWIAKEKVK
jgi:excisionase family DNA binding protein